MDRAALNRRGMCRLRSTMVKLPRVEESDRFAVRAVLCFVVAFGIAVGFGAFLLASSGSAEVFGEGGPFEFVTLCLWLALGAGLVVAVRPLSPAVLAGAYICLCCAAREADWHKSFTGYSVMKVHFYYMPEHPVSHRLIAAVLVIPLIVSLVVLGVALVRRACSSNWRPMPGWMVIAALGAAVLVVTKSLDRVPELSEDWISVRFSERLGRVLLALEEGYEMLLPVLFGASALLLVRSERSARRRASGDVGAALGAAP